MKFAAFALVAMVATAGFASAQYTSIGDAIQNLPNTKELAAQYSTTGLAKQFADPALVATAFVPDDAAMKALNKTLESAGYTADMVTGEQSILTDALKYHVAIGKALTAADLTDGQKITMENGETVTVKINPTTKAVSIIGGSPSNKVNVVKANVKAGDSVVHLIDGVLLPKDYAEAFAIFAGVSDPDSAGMAGLVEEETPAASKPAKAAVAAAVNSTKDAAAAAEAPYSSPAPSSAAGLSVAAALMAVPALMALL